MGSYVSTNSHASYLVLLSSRMLSDGGHTTSLIQNFPERQQTISTALKELKVNYLNAEGNLAVDESVSSIKKHLTQLRIELATIKEINRNATPKIRQDDDGEESRIKFYEESIGEMEQTLRAFMVSHKQSTQLQARNRLLNMNNKESLRSAINQKYLSTIWFVMFI